MQANIYEAWQSGHATDVEAFGALAGDLQEVEQMYKRADDARKTLREQLTAVVVRMGGKAQTGAYEAAMTSPAKVVSYDSKALDSFMAECLAAGEMHTAQRIAEARRESARAGYLKIGATKGKGE